ncbi:MAG: MBL fold metallo-hydrolase [Dehalococcoidales bacterium]|nr:MBL fold metallo-hydrolase [Dehalococcoidales bacterium]
MKIKYLGHAAFVITSDAGVKIITDPYETGPGLTYGEITESAGVVTVSHDHLDHCNVAAVRGNPEVVRRTGRSTAKGAEFRGIATYHDEAKGRLRGNNIIFCFEVDGIRVCHLGDLGHLLDDKQLAEIGSVDILLIPVGGFFTIDARAATQVCDQLKPKVIIPMHYRTEKSFPDIAGVDEFIKGKNNVTRQDSSEVEFKAGKLPATGQIIVLKPAL